MIVNKYDLTNLIPYVDYLIKYRTLPVLNHKTYCSISEDKVESCYINETDLSIAEEHYDRYFSKTYIEDTDENRKLNIVFGGKRQHAIEFANWLAENMVNYISQDKKVNFNNLYIEFINEL